MGLILIAAGTAGLVTGLLYAAGILGRESDCEREYPVRPFAELRAEGRIQSPPQRWYDEDCSDLY